MACDSLLDIVELYWAKQTPRGRWDGIKQVGTAASPESWTTKKLSALESSLKQRVNRLTAELEALKAQGGPNGKKMGRWSLWTREANLRIYQESGRGRGTMPND